MIATIIIVGLAFIWLGYETDWMRVRLPRGRLTVCELGACCQWRLSDDAVTKDMILWLTAQWNLTKIQDALFTQGNLSPLCGWGYAYQYKEFMPECRIELLTENSHYTMNIKNPAVFKDVLRVYRNPYIKVPLKKLTYWEMAQSHKQLCASLAK